MWDWVGLFKVGDPNTGDVWWWEYTSNRTSVTFTLPAYVPPGQYEFRYLLDDGYNDAARSSRITVTAPFTAKQHLN